MHVFTLAGLILAFCASSFSRSPLRARHHDHNHRGAVESLNSSTSTVLRSTQSQIYVGTAVEESLLAEKGQYNSLVSSQFNMLTPNNEMKWDSTEATQGVFSYTEADKIVAFAKQNNMRVRGHTLVWYKQTPDWVNNLDAAALNASMVNHITNVMGHYKGQLYSWDVLNEIFSDKGDGSYRDSFWYSKLGETFPVIAMKAARAADPNVKLYINDYSVEGRNAKSDALYNLTKTLKEQGLIDGVGFQSHFFVGQVPADLHDNLQRFVDLGVEVAITELDVRMYDPGSAADFTQQANDYATVVHTCKKVSKCVSTSVWGVGYNDSWIPSNFPGQGHALLYDANYNPTAAYQSFAEALAQ